MVTYCCVYGCKNNGTMKGIRFHRFPSKLPKLAKTWEVTLKMGKKPSNTMVVCSSHFKKDDYKAIPQAHRDKFKYPPRLRPLAIPSQNLPICKRDTESTQSSKNEGMSSDDDRDHQVEKIGVNNQPDDITESEENGLRDTPDICDTDNSSLEKGIILNTLEEHKCKVPASCGILKQQTVVALTGIQTMELFNEIVKIVSEEYPSKSPLPVADGILLTLMKLKLGISYSALGALFGLSQRITSSYFKETLCELATVLESSVKWLEKEEIVEAMPHCFKEYADTRVVLDCTEVSVEKPKCLKCKIKTYSHYKGTNTVKVCICVAPSGVITMVSKAYGGKSSDKQIIEECGVLERCIPYADAIMVDKGFAIEDLCNERGLKLIRPPFLKRKAKGQKNIEREQFPREDALLTSKIACARVHVERTIQRLKTFNIFHQRLPWDLLPYINKMFVVISAVVNLSTAAILADNKF